MISRHLLILLLLSALSFRASADDEASVPLPSMDGLNLSHPRLLTSPDLIADIRASVEAGGPPLAQWVPAAIAEATTLLTEPLISYPAVGNDMLDQSRMLMRRAYTLGFAYLYTKDERYAQRLWSELEPAAKMDSWRADIQFLTAAEMLHGFAIAYDWLHDFWTPEQRGILENAIRDNGLKAGHKAYTGELPGFAGWDSSNNWNVVCNGSLILGAVALLPVAEPLCNEIIAGAFHRLPRVLAQYKSDGGWAEGVTYWGYTTTYLGTLLGALDTAYGDDFGLIVQAPGLPETGYFPIYLRSPSGLPFNFADSEHGTPRTPAMFLLANLFNNPHFADYQLEHGQGTVADILGWARAKKSIDNDATRTPLLRDRWFPEAGVMSWRSAWDDPDALFFALKAGSNGANHGHLDLGSFVLDAHGHRWIHDLQKESYGSPGFFESSEGGRRWLYYALRAEGHNTLVINPSPKKADQYPRAQSKLVNHIEDLADGPEATFDLTDAYLPAAKNVIRTARMTHQRSRIEIEDRIALKAPGTVVWSVHVRDPIHLSDDGRTATLSHGSKRLTLEMLSPEAGSFEVLPAEPLILITAVPQRANPGFKKIVIRVDDTPDAHIHVGFTPSVVD